MVSHPMRSAQSAVPGPPLDAPRTLCASCGSKADGSSGSSAQGGGASAARGDRGRAAVVALPKEPVGGIGQTPGLLASRRAVVDVEIALVTHEHFGCAVAMSQARKSRFES